MYVIRIGVYIFIAVSIFLFYLVEYWYTNVKFVSHGLPDIDQCMHKLIVKKQVNNKLFYLLQVSVSNYVCMYGCVCVS